VECTATQPILFEGLKSPLKPPVQAAPASALPATRVAVVEDDSALRRTIAAFINRAPGHCCAGAFPDAETALAEIPHLKPDVVLMDIGLPGMSGIECVAALKELLPATPIIMLTVYDEGDYLFESLKAGASGYLLKRAMGDKLIEALQEARAGGLPLTRHMAAQVSQYFQEVGKKQKEARTEFTQLSPREQDVVKLLAAGFRYKEIAAELGISLDTVREHARRIYTKLHVSSRTEAVVKYLGGKTPPPPA
jgi:DNA-binding NarL/FixJ family response regulator